MPTIDDVIALYQDYHWPDELRMMNRIAARVNRGIIVAIGSYRGQMDCALALDAQTPVYCIDPRYQHDTHYGDVDRPYWMQNILAMGVAERVRPINLSSVRATAGWTQPIGLLFVDGDHNKAGVDLEVWMPHVIEGGLVAMHDSGFDSVDRAVSNRKDLIEVERADVTIVYRKVA